MRERETRMGGRRELFPDTPWTMILGARGPVTPRQREQLDAFISLYWRPVYAYIRRSGRPVEDAKDLTQEFFRRVLEDRLLSRFDPAQGSLRAFLKGALRLFLAQDVRDRGRLKRGGDRLPVSLERLEAFEREGLADPGQAPEDSFDRHWAEELMRQALADLRPALEREGKVACFEAYRLYELEPGPSRPTYETVGLSAGLTSDEVRLCLEHALHRLRALLLDRIRGYSACPRDAERELRELFGSA